MKNEKKFSTEGLLVCFITPLILLLIIKYAIQKSEMGYVSLGNPIMNMNGEVGHSQAKLPDTIDFIFHVKPILSDRCYLCHGPDEGTREGGLRLDTQEGAYAAIGEHLDRHAIVPGSPEKSAMISRINETDQEKVMPPKDSNLMLTDTEKQILAKWVKQGAKWKAHWAFIAPVKKPVPHITDADWQRNEIDFFIAKRLEQEGLKPSPQEGKEKLIRKLYFDLTGLPPSPENIDAFLADSDPNAYEKVVDKLLASPAYGERMAADWLDIARYADTHGYQDDLERIMWPWRDWVISAFNRNMPFDKFITWQLAGDLLPDASLEQIVATGFNRNHKITQEGGVIDEEYRVEYVMDRTSTTAKTLLGLTMECARCHDHKYDPISQKEFYGFYGFFNKVKERGQINFGEIPEPNISITQKEIAESLAFVNMPDSIKEVKLMVMKDDAANRKTFVLNRGQYDAPKEEVAPSTPTSILPFPETYANNRLGLAKWFFDETNPLTARVAVNRMWQQVFGVGLVSTSDDFGNQGALPSHPELLDWLAVTFREEGWDMKKMYKRMVMSSTYRQTSKVSLELLEADPDNVLLARSTRSRLTAEMIRDNALAVSGLLVNKLGGPSVKPYQPEGLWAETSSGVQGQLIKYKPDKGENKYRRSLYTFWKRTIPPPSMAIFDAPTRDFCEVKRQKTSTPLQALVMMNDPQLMEASETLARSILKDTQTPEEERIKYIFRKITSRYPDEKEVETLRGYISKVKRNDEGSSHSNIDSQKQGSTMSSEDLKAYTTMISLIFNLDESMIKG
ncbi:PSD1 and planctomycete cytochrome C domain-containing protein [Snuella sedimenti]|uniref:PSD1 domain-containing protein n=1 Tax=Snuella sedimenti TaxID=2798802 RepID=A0A8J7J359_9FLAO|nr:PSD1 and planctomycete cytochrome C domain-containing protein [Snuella sedimenti]MBJ6367478.1 PSD1 domain-containing protein [Snuella sedimenti]